MTSEAANSSKSYFSLFVPSPSHASLLVPQNSFQYQRSDSSSSSRILSHSNHLKQYPFGGPMMEILYESTRKFCGLPFSIKQSRRLVEELSGEGFPKAENFSTEVELNILSPLNFLFKHYETRMDQYDRFYYIMLFIFLFLFVCTFFIGGFMFVFMIYIAPLLKMRYMRRFDKNIKKQIREILKKENERYLKYGIEWVIYYKFKQTVSNSIMIGHWMDITIVQDATLRLIRIAKYCPDDFHDFSALPLTPTALTPTFQEASSFTNAYTTKSSAGKIVVPAKPHSPLKTNVVAPYTTEEQEPPHSNGNSSPLFIPTHSTATPYCTETNEATPVTTHNESEESPYHETDAVTPFIEASNEVTPFVELVD